MTENMNIMTKSRTKCNHLKERHFIRYLTVERMRYSLALTEYIVYFIIAGASYKGDQTVNAELKQLK